MKMITPTRHEKSGTFADRSRHETADLNGPRDDEEQRILSARPHAGLPEARRACKAHLSGSTIAAHTFTYAPNVIVARSTSRITVPVRS